MNDPLGIFEKPQAKQVSEPGFGSFLRNVLLVAALAVLGVVAYERFAPDGSDDKRQDEQEQVEPAQKPETVVFVAEANDQPAEHVLLLREVKTLGIKYRMLDDELAEAEKFKQYGLTKGVQPPMAVLLDSANKPYAVQDWPTIEQVQAWKK